MPGIAARIKHEIAEVLPATIFFLVAFNLLAATKALFLLEHGIRITNFVGATIGALLVAKVILIADKIPFINRYPDKPLIFNTVWKTAIYIVATFIVRVIEHLIPSILDEGGIGAAWNHMLEAVVWPRFFAIYLWLCLLFFTFAALRELGRQVGRERVLEMFFGPAPIAD
jgi:hypothetical protein